MNKYKCPVCGAVSYSAASPETLKDDKCLAPECEGRVEMEKREAEARHERQMEN